MLDIYLFFGLSDKVQNKIRTRLYNSLVSIADQLAIPITHLGNLDTAAGKLILKSIGGRYILSDARIEIKNEFKGDPFLLAHELGHFLAIRQFQDNSEKGADNAGYKLCCAILTPLEQKCLRIALGCRLSQPSLISDLD